MSALTPDDRARHQEAMHASKARSALQRPPHAPWTGALSGCLGGIVMFAISDLDTSRTVQVTLGLAISTLIGFSVDLWLVRQRLVAMVELMRRHDDDPG